MILSFIECLWDKYIELKGGIDILIVGGVLKSWYWCKNTIRPWILKSIGLEYKTWIYSIETEQIHTIRYWIILIISGEFIFTSCTSSHTLTHLYDTRCGKK